MVPYNREIIELLLKSDNEILYKENNNGEVALHNAFSREIAELLLSYDIDNRLINWKNKDGLTPVDKIRCKRFFDKELTYFFEEYKEEQIEKEIQDLKDQIKMLKERNAELEEMGFKIVI